MNPKPTSAHSTAAAALQRSMDPAPQHHLGLQNERNNLQQWGDAGQTMKSASAQQRQRRGPEGK